MGVKHVLGNKPYSTIETRKYFTTPVFNTLELKQSLKILFLIQKSKLFFEKLLVYSLPIKKLFLKRKIKNKYFSF